MACLKSRLGFLLLIYLHFCLPSSHLHHHVSESPFFGCFHKHRLELHSVLVDNLKFSIGVISYLHLIKLPVSLPQFNHVILCYIYSVHMFLYIEVYVWTHILAVGRIVGVVGFFGIYFGI